MRTPTTLRRLRHCSTIAAATLAAFTAAVLHTAAPAHAQAPPPPAPEADPQLAAAKQYFEAGKNAYNAGDYVGAIRSFKEAERLRPSPMLDYNIGLANEKLGKRRVATKYYRRYLEQVPTATNRPQVEAAIAQLEREIAAQQGGAGPGTPPPGPVEQPADMPPQQPNYPPPAQPNQPPGQPSYDPYGSQSQAQGGYYTQAPPKKKSYWWVALIVVGGVVLISVVAVAAYFLTRPSYYYGTGLTGVGAPAPPATHQANDWSARPTPQHAPTLLNYTLHF